MWRHFPIRSLALTCTLALTGCVSWPHVRLASQERLNGSTTLRAFSPATRPLQRLAAAVVDASGRRLGLATNYDGSGAYVCKASEVTHRGALRLRHLDGVVTPVAIAGVDDISDLALLQPGEPIRGTPPWSDAAPAEGTWVACLDDLGSAKVGIVSGPHRKIDRRSAMLGVILKPADEKPGPVIDEVLEHGAANRARLKPEDRILAMNHRAMQDKKQLERAVRALQPGTQIVLDFERRGRHWRKILALGDKTMTEGENRNLKMSGRVSSRRAGFEEVFQHDSPLTPESMGGPVVNLKGQLVGVNIARSDRVTTLALTPRAVHNAVARINRPIPDEASSVASSNP